MIHRCDARDHAYIRIKCDRSWVSPNRSIDSDDGRDIYATDDGRLYTFDDQLVTCEGCM